MKKGVSLLILVVAVSVMLIFISSAVVIGKSSIDSANFEEFKSMISRVDNNINEYYVRNGKLPTTDIQVEATSLGTNFLASITDMGDTESRLFVVDISMLSDSTIKKGSGTVKNKDVFLVSDKTHNVYYLGGFKYKGQVYFSK